MKQSERVTEDIRWAHAQLSSMSKEELDKRLAARELGPVGRILLETGAINYALGVRQCPATIGECLLADCALCDGIPFGGRRKEPTP